MRYFNASCTTLLLCAAMLTGCKTPPAMNTSEAKYQEDILLNVKNYGGLITLYRSWLKQKEDPQTRLKLAHYYSLSGDAESSLYYLQPLLQSPTLPLYSLQARDLIALGHYSQAIQVADRMIQMAPREADAWNLRGIAQAMNNQLGEGQRSLEKARSLFIADEVALNNLAMLAMLQQRYQEAIDLLLPQYLQGHKQEPLLHNLILCLVKVGETRYAHEIIRKEKLSRNPEALTEALAQLTPLGKRIEG
ncbi:tetratricopeptide repeat protein [Erwinia sp.]|uniref:tetratricopeptide repeat protein n=1 Tax=Erwinia citreus TaxID=558 RepID=UPI003C741277